LPALIYKQWLPTVFCWQVFRSGFPILLIPHSSLSLRIKPNLAGKFNDLLTMSSLGSKLHRVVALTRYFSSDPVQSCLYPRELRGQVVTIGLRASYWQKQENFSLLMLCSSHKTNWVGLLKAYPTLNHT
jgi:hypothetical protein